MNVDLSAEQLWRLRSSSTTSSSLRGFPSGVGGLTLQKPVDDPAGLLAVLLDVAV